MSVHGDISQICCIVVTYQPDPAVLRQQMESIPGACHRVVVDNASEPGLFVRTQEMLAEFDVEVSRNADNLGLAAAQNQGAALAIQQFPQAKFLLFLDQDTVPGAGAVEALLDGYLTAASVHGAGAAGPRMVDVATGLHHGFHVMRGLRWVRVYPPATQREPVECANLNGSGTLVQVPVWIAAGGMDGALFIDHVDTDWAFRMRALGYKLYGIPGSDFAHRMGEASHRVWLFGWHVWPTRSPRRHYFLFRNTVRLMQRDHVPAVWKAWAGAKLLLTVVVTVCTDDQKREQFRQMIRGFRDG